MSLRLRLPASLRGTARARCLVLVLVLVPAMGLGCSARPWAALWPWGEPEPEGDPAHGVEVVRFEGVTGFLERAEVFYSRLAQRRIDTHATYQDLVLREYFRSEKAFADYYADLAHDLAAAAFERTLPLTVEVAEFVFEAPGDARVKVLLVGGDDRPLRPGTRKVEREDQWRRIDGRWWIVPSKL